MLSWLFVELVFCKVGFGFGLCWICFGLSWVSFGLGQFWAGLAWAFGLGWLGPVWLWAGSALSWVGFLLGWLWF